MKNQSFRRKLKLARKNAQREIALSHKAGIEERYDEIKCPEEICFKYSYPLGLMIKSVSSFDRIIKMIKWKSFQRITRKIRRKGQVVTEQNIYNFYKLQDNDLRKLKGSNYSICRLLEDFKRSKKYWIDFYKYRYYRVPR